MQRMKNYLSEKLLRFRRLNKALALSICQSEYFSVKRKNRLVQQSQVDPFLCCYRFRIVQGVVKIKFMERKTARHRKFLFFA